jgi:molybdenum cofactor biosynthesis enzyme MoaA
MPARSWSKGTDHAAQYPRRPYDNQYNRYCAKCDSYRLHTKGRKYWTCLTCDTRTARELAARH